VKNQWPLISASYRLLPQVDGEGLLQDAEAAYAFAKKLGISDNEAERRVIAAGASAGRCRPRPRSYLWRTDLT
jgi:acetyl esterase/lipase